MENKNNRLYFIDAIRAWAILMMLQGHFVDGLLDNAFRDNTNEVFGLWKYFRGITAPVFFTVSGFIFTFLLIRDPRKGLENPRVQKGVKRGLQLLFIGYLLRMNLFGILQGEIYESFYLVDVLHCIGLSLLGIIGVYLLTQNGKKYLFPAVLTAITLLLFVFEPYYKQWTFSVLPNLFANYLSKTNGSVFTIFPWFGYSAIGAVLSILFARFQNFKYLYPMAIGLAALTGFGLIYYSSAFFLNASEATGIKLFADIFYNNYLFIRLGNVFLVFAVFMVFKSFLTNKTVLKIGQSTLSIYVVHFIILYGSFTGLGLYRFFNHSLAPLVVIPGALLFMGISTYTALQYEKHKVEIKVRIALAQNFIFDNSENLLSDALEQGKTFFYRVLRILGWVKNRS